MSPHEPAGPVYELSEHAKPEAIVVHCSDPRFQEAFARFIGDELHLAPGQFVPIVVGGGAGILARPHLMPQEFRFLKERIDRHRRDFPTLRRAVLINHQDCRYYEMIREKGRALLGLHITGLEPPREDLPAIAKALAEQCPHLGIAPEIYYARFADSEGRRVTFERVRPTG